MKKSDLAKNHGAFDDALGRYRAFMVRIEGAQRVIRTKTEKQDIAESVILRLCAHWERFVDEHLVDCVNVDHSRLNDYLGGQHPKPPESKRMSGSPVRRAISRFPELWRSERLLEKDAA